MSDGQSVFRGRGLLYLSLGCGVACASVSGLSVGSADAGPDGAVAPRAILFGGYNEGVSVYLDDTWSFDGQVWTQLKPPSSPPAASQSAIATLGASLLLFGGNEPSMNVGNDTWSFSEDRWTEEELTEAPPPRSSAGVAVLGSTVLLFGGYGEAQTSLQDTWLWNGTSWSELHPKTVPPVRDSAAMAALGGKAVMFGGENTGLNLTVALGDTWLWDGSNWEQVYPSHSPQARLSPGFAAVGAVLLLFGGLDDNGNALGDTWTWDGTDWTELHPGRSPSPRGGPMMAAFQGGALLFGGVIASDDLADTWLWSGSDWISSPAMGPSARAGGALSAL
jgi:hypothetical protein